MKFFTIAIKGLKEIVRDRELLAMTLLFPAVFMLVFGYAFGAVGGQNTPHDIVVLNDDVGAYLNYGDSRYFNFGENFTQVLRNLKYENSTVPMFILHNATREEAINLLMKRSVACIVTIPENFSEAMEATINSTIRVTVTSLIGEVAIEFLQQMGSGEAGGFDNATFLGDGFNFTFPENETLPPLPEAENVTATVVIEGDMGYMSFGIAQSIIQGVLSRYIEVIRSEAREQVLQAIPEEIEVNEEFKHVYVEIESVSGTRAFTGFDYQAPGIIVFGLLMGSTGVAGALARETEYQTLSRLKVSLMSSFDLLFGTLLPWTLLALAQLLILFGVALAIGFHWVGGTSSLLIAIFIGGITGVACVSLGLLVAAFSKSEGHATTLGVLVSVPLSFLIGAFFPLPSQAEAVTVFLPWRQAFMALLSVLTYGAQLQDVMPNITAMILETAVIFTVGVIAFAKTRLKAE
jgi:ABC-2 type transport system permease protein